MPIEKKIVEVAGCEYELEHLPGHAARTAFLVAFRALGDAFIHADSDRAVLAASLSALRDAPPEAFDKLVELLAPRTKLVKRLSTTQDALTIPLAWNDHFVGARALDQFGVISHHLVHNFGAAFLGESVNLTASRATSQSSEKPASES